MFCAGPPARTLLYVGRLRRNRNRRSGNNLYDCRRAERGGRPNQLLQRHEEQLRARAGEHAPEKSHLDLRDQARLRWVYDLLGRCAVLDWRLQRACISKGSLCEFR